MTRGKLLSKSTVLLNNKEEFIGNENELVVKLLNNLTTKKNKHRSIKVLLSKLEDLLNNLRGYQSVLESEFKASIVLFCIRNKLIYLNCLRKIYPRKNKASLKFMLESLQEKGILRRIKKKEFLKDQQIFNTFVIRNTHAGYYHVKKIRYYTLTNRAKKIFSVFIRELELLSKHTKLINNFKHQLAQSHKQLKIKAKMGKKKLQEAIETLREKKDHQDFDKFLHTWSDKILPQFSILLTSEELKSKVIGDPL